MDSIAANIARNIKQLREMRGYTQDQLAKYAAVPRSTLTNLESGSANPTVSLVVKVAEVLQVTLEEIVGPPREECQFFPASSIAQKKRGDLMIRKLLPDSIRSTLIERMEFPPDGRLVGTPHRTGTREYLTCESGMIQLRVVGNEFILKPGDVVVFRGDQRHWYHNPDHRPAVAYSIVLLSPPSDE